jgi:hypothetical protein
VKKSENPDGFSVDHQCAFRLPLNAFLITNVQPSSSHVSKTHSSLIQRIQTRHLAIVYQCSNIHHAIWHYPKPSALEASFHSCIHVRRKRKARLTPFPPPQPLSQSLPFPPASSNNNIASAITSIQLYSYRASILVSYHRTPHNSPLLSPTPTQHRQNRERIFNGSPQVHTISPPIKESPRVIACAGIVTESSAHQTPTWTPSYSSASSLSRRGLDLPEIDIEVQVAVYSWRGRWGGEEAGKERDIEE